MTYEVTLFGINITLNPVAFTLPIGDGWKVYWYGILIAVGALGAFIYAYFNYKRFNLDMDRMLDVVIVTLPVAILCARTYYVIFDGEKLTSFKDFFGLGNGQGFAGLGIYGGVIGAFATGFIMCKIRKVNFADMFDIAAIGFLIGQGIGRWGNFVNQEAFGSLTKGPGMMSNEVMDYICAYPKNFGLEGKSTYEIMNHITSNDLSVHPCFFYESIWCLVGFVVIHFLSKKRKFSGEVFLMYLAWYGFGRALIEPLRTDSLMIGPFKVSLLLAIFLCITSIVLIFVIRSKIKANSGDYQSVFETEEAAAVITADETELEQIETVEETIIEGEENVQTD